MPSRRSKSKDKDREDTQEESMSSLQQDVLSFHSLTKVYKELSKEAESGEKYQTSTSRIMAAYKKAMLENVEVICSVGISLDDSRHGGCVTDITSKRKPIMEYFSTEEKFKKKKENNLVQCLYALETALSLWGDIFNENATVFVINDKEVENVFEYESLHSSPLSSDEKAAARGLRQALKKVDVDCMFIGVDESTCINKVTLAGDSDSANSRFEKRIDEYLGDDFRVKFVDPDD